MRPLDSGSIAVTLRMKNVRWTDGDDGGIVVLDLRAGRYLSVNASGSLLWQSLTAGATPAEMADAIVARYGIALAAAQDDVRLFLDMLGERDLLEPTG